MQVVLKMKVGTSCLLFTLAVIIHQAFGAYIDESWPVLLRLVDAKQQLRQVKAKYTALNASCFTSMYTPVHYPYRFYSVVSNVYPQSMF